MNEARWQAATARVGSGAGGIAIALWQADCHSENAVPKKKIPRPTISPRSRRARRLAWGVLAAGTGYLASRATQMLMDRAWEKTRGERPPRDPLARGTSWPTVLGWTMATAVVVAVAQVGAKRGAAGLFERATGHRPPTH